MVRVLFLAIGIFATPALWSYERILEGEVVVLEAPAFRIQNSKAKVIQYFRKGEKVKLHPIHDISNPWSRNYVFFTNVQGSNELVDLERFLIDQEKRIAFYKTIDRNGKPAYILKDHVKPIYNDIREYQRLVRNYLPDQTDYRIEEPLPSGYPLIQESGYRSSFIYGVGLPSNYDYSYTAPPTAAKDDISHNFLIGVWKQGDPQLDSRLYYGMEFFSSYFRKDTSFANEANGKESNQLMGIGPALNYDVFRRDDYRLSFQGSLIFNFTDNLRIRVQDQFQYFKNYSLTPVFKFFYQRINVIENFDFMMGPVVRVQLPRKLRLEEESLGENLSNRLSYQKNLAADLSFVIGFQNSF